MVIALPGDLPACGDKFLVPSRGARFRFRVVDRESATVLLYARPGSALAETLRTLSVEARLRTAGYRPTLVGSREEFASACRRGGWDVVVVDLADASDVDRLSTSWAPLVLPVAQGVPRAAVDEAKRQYRLVLKSPTKYRAFLDAIDEAIAVRTRARARPVASASS
jgi:DNA-binding NtrC family response regulator